jgi:ABC-2 type transport system permease protein
MRWADIRDSMLEEFAAMTSGHFTPYHIAAWVMACVSTLLFSIMMSHGLTFEGKLAVIDLDRSSYTQQLINRLQASPYLEITEVVSAPVNPEVLLQHDRNIGVLYFPKGLEKAATRGDASFKVGFYADQTNIAQNGQLLGELPQIIPEISTMITKRLPAVDEQSGVSVGTRDLYNPTHSSTMIFAVTFMYFFSSILYGITVLMLIGRLKITGAWRAAVLPRGPLALIARIAPYAFIYTTVITTVTVALVLFGQQRFAGNYFFFVPSIFMTGMGIGMLGYLLCWNTTNPAQGASRMILVVPPGFIMGGALLTTGFFNPDLIHVKWLWPLTWQYSLWRDFSMRGLSFSEMAGQYGAYIIYLCLLGLVITFLFWRETKKEEKFEEVLDGMKPPEEAAAGH